MRLHYRLLGGAGAVVDAGEAVGKAARHLARKGCDARSLAKEKARGKREAAALEVRRQEMYDIALSYEGDIGAQLRELRKRAIAAGLSEEAAREVVLRAFVDMMGDVSPHLRKEVQKSMEYK